MSPKLLNTRVRPRTSPVMVASAVRFIFHIQVAERTLLRPQAGGSTGSAHGEAVPAATPASGAAGGGAAPPPPRGGGGGGGSSLWAFPPPPGRGPASGASSADIRAARPAA